MTGPRGEWQSLINSWLRCAVIWRNKVIFSNFAKVRFKFLSDAISFSILCRYSAAFYILVGASLFLKQRVRLGLISWGTHHKSDYACSKSILCKLEHTNTFAITPIKDNESNIHASVTLALFLRVKLSWTHLLENTWYKNSYLLCCPGTLLPCHQRSVGKSVWEVILPDSGVKCVVFVWGQLIFQSLLRTD